ncbi:hypothetical protein Tco_1253899 [Tanacetum coccineum]
MGFCDKYNMVAFLQKPYGSEEFHQIVDFLADSHIRYALTANPTIYVSLVEEFWQTATVKTVNDGEQHIKLQGEGQTFSVKPQHTPTASSSSTSQPTTSQPTSSQATSSQAPSSHEPTPEPITTTSSPHLQETQILKTCPCPMFTS